MSLIFSDILHLTKKLCFECRFSQSNIKQIRQISTKCKRVVLVTTHFFYYRTICRRRGVATIDTPSCIVASLCNIETKRKVFEQSTIIARRLLLWSTVNWTINWGVWVSVVIGHRHHRHLIISSCLSWVLVLTGYAWRHHIRCTVHHK